MIVEHLHGTRAEASGHAADLIAAAIESAIDESGSSNVVVSGGTTPLDCFRNLASKDLHWQDVMFFLSDERWVANDHDSSNEKMVRNELLNEGAAEAGLLPIFEQQSSPQERCAKLQSELPDRGFTVSMLGMGTDGHFASLFGDAENLDTGLDSLSSAFYIPVETAGSPHPRVSMTLSALLGSDQILLLFFGEEKRAVFERAKAGDESLPIATLLRNASIPVHVVWAP